MVAEIKNELAKPAVYLPCSALDRNLYCIILKAGRWKSHFSELQYKIMIAEALNYWVNTPQLKADPVKITGYLISSQKVCLVLYHQHKFRISWLQFFYEAVEKEIRRHQHLHKHSHAGMTEKEKGTGENNQLFEICPFTNEYLLLLITGRRVELPYHNPHLGRLKSYIQNNNFCSALDYSGAKGPVEVSLLPQYYSPFNYRAGINYQSREQHPINHHAVKKELNFLAGYFSLIKTFNCAEETGGRIKMEETMQSVVDFITQYKQRTLQLIMGSNNNTLALKDKKAEWVRGLMTDPGYTDKWVAMIIKAFGGRANAAKHLACICLGNEIDAYGPPDTDRNFKNYCDHWIPKAFTHLRNSLAAHGLAGIPVTTTIKNYSLQNPVSNRIAFAVTKFINDHWGLTWNKNKPFVFFNHYTADAGESADFDTVRKYFFDAHEMLYNAPQVFAGQTGYSSAYGSAKQATVIAQVFQWIYDPYGNYEFKTPVCLFEAFDNKDNTEDQQQMGLFENGRGGHCKLKQGIEIPAWVNQPI